MLAKRVHRMMAIALGVFIISHLTVHMFALFGPAMHDRALQTVQVLYRNPIGESLLVLAIVTQIASGASRLRFGGVSGWARAQVISGVYLFFFLLMHTSAALYTHHIYGLETDFYWAAGGFHFSPIKYGFALYYIAAVLAVFTHLAAALHFGWPEVSSRLVKSLPVMGLAVGSVIVAVFGGAFYAIDPGPDVRAYYEGNFGWVGLTPPEDP